MFVKKLLLFSFVFLLFTALFLVVDTKDAKAIPAWARKYKTSCVTCHYAYPRLNKVGRAFRNNGFRFPDDADMTKEEKIELGAESYKRVWPDAIWPGDMGYVPIGFHLIGRANFAKDKTPNSEFEFPHEFEVLLAGTIGETFSYFGEIEIENEDGENELGMEFFLQYDPKPGFHVRVGSIDVLPIKENARLTREHYNYGDFRVAADRWRFRDGQSGIEVNGAFNGSNGKGGFTYAGGIVNGNGNVEENNGKDFFFRAAYKIGGFGEVGGTEGLESETSKYWQDDSIKLGVFTYRGDHEITEDADNTFTVLGVNWDLFYKDLNIFGAYLRQNDDDPQGDGVEVDSNAWFLEGNYVIYPWLIGIARYEWTEIGDPDEPKKQFVPGLTILPRANIGIRYTGLIRLDDRGDEHLGRDRHTVQVDFAF